MGDTHHRIPHVVRHGRALRYRRIVPPDVREAVGRQVWLRSFPRRTPIAAVEREASGLAAAHDALIRRARDGEILTPELVASAEEQARGILSLGKAARYEFLALLGSEPTLAPTVAAVVNAVEHGGRYTPERLPLTAAHARDRERHGGDRREAPFEYAVASFVRLVGDKDVREVTRADAAQWIEKLARDGLAPATIRRRLAALRALVNRAFLELGHEGRNPFERQNVRGGGGRADDRLPFSRAHLARIDDYLASSRHLGHETRNLIRLMKGTGAGPAEVGGLSLADVDLDGEVPSIWIRPNAIRGLKAEARDRRVPLVGEALDAARDACRRATAKKPRRASSESVPLFPGFGASGRGADSLSAKVNMAIRAAGVPKSPRLVGYSFRHTVKEALRSAGVADHVQRRLLGHAGQGVADRYGSPQGRLAEARDALVKAMEHLGDVDPRIYRASERVG
jgi:integrase